MTLDPAAAPAASTVVARQAADSTCEILQVELVMTAVPDVQTVEFTASFDASVARYEGVSLSGSTLTSGGADVDVFEDEEPGRVTVALTRFNTGVDFVPEGTLVRLIFGRATDADGAAGALVFSDTRIFDSDTPPNEKTGIQWLGGTFRIAL
jgi:hypothetical protein